MNLCALHTGADSKMSEGIINVSQRRPSIPFIFIRPGTSIFVDFLNGDIFKGCLQQAENHEFPTWITDPHHHVEYLIYVRMPDNTVLISNLTRLITHRVRPRRMQCYTQLQNNNMESAFLQTLDENQPENLETRVYVGVPDGTVFTGIFEQV